MPGPQLFYAKVHLLGGPAPVRRFLPELTGLIWNREIDPGRDHVTSRARPRYAAPTTP